MKGDLAGAPREGGPQSKALAAAKQRRSRLEVALATAGLAAWLWCVYEVALALLK